tara:strand:+ start:205 stop:432 length:228 start_codon:yes stop_codon:yes gene_type:complete
MGNLTNQIHQTDIPITKNKQQTHPEASKPSNYQKQTETLSTNLVQQRNREQQRSTRIHKHTSTKKLKNENTLLNT